MTLICTCGTCAAIRADRRDREERQRAARELADIRAKALRQSTSGNADFPGPPPVTSTNTPDLH